MTALWPRLPDLAGTPSDDFAAALPASFSKYDVRFSGLRSCTPLNFCSRLDTRYSTLTLADPQGLVLLSVPAGTFLKVCYANPAGCLLWIIETACRFFSACHFDFIYFVCVFKLRTEATFTRASSAWRRIISPFSTPWADIQKGSPPLGNEGLDSCVPFFFLSGWQPWPSLHAPLLHLRRPGSGAVWKAR